MASSTPPPPKTITGYCDRWSLRAGESISLRSSSHDPGPAAISLVRISCGDPTSAGPGFSEHPVQVDLPADVTLDEQSLVPGSYASVDLAGINATATIALNFSMLATLPKEPQTIATLCQHNRDAPLFQIVLVDAIVQLATADQQLALRSRPLAKGRWYDVSVAFNLATNEVEALVTTQPSASPARDLFELETEPLTATIALSAEKAEPRIVDSAARARARRKRPWRLRRAHRSTPAHHRQHRNAVGPCSRHGWTDHRRHQQ